MRKLREKLNDFSKAWKDLSNEWDKENADLSASYPFQESFDELWSKVDNWVKDSMKALESVRENRREGKTPTISKLSDRLSSTRTKKVNESSAAGEVSEVTDFVYDTIMGNHKDSSMTDAFIDNVDSQWVDARKGTIEFTTNEGKTFVVSVKEK